MRPDFLLLPASEGVFGLKTCCGSEEDAKRFLAAWEVLDALSWLLHTSELPSLVDFARRVRKATRGQKCLNTAASHRVPGHEPGGATRR